MSYHCRNYVRSTLLWCITLCGIFYPKSNCFRLSFLGDIRWSPWAVSRYFAVTGLARLAYLGAHFLAVYKALCQPMLSVTYCEHVNVYLVCETCTVDVAMPVNKPSFTLLDAYLLLLPNTLPKTTLDSAKASLWTLTGYGPRNLEVQSCKLIIQLHSDKPFKERRLSISEKNIGS